MLRLSRGAAAFAAVVIALLAFTQPAFAHERRTVGPYTLVVGFAAEPALAGEPNGVSLRLSDTASTKPVEGAEKTLTVDVAAGGLKAVTLPLRAVFGTPGLYQADLIPTKDGQYIFTFKGKIGTLDVNERFESGPGRFNDVESTTKLQYPEQVPGGADLTKRLADLQSAADQARLVAIGGVMLGLVGIVMALRTRRGS